MILSIIRMKVFSGKQVELSQTIASLSEFTRMEKGCQRCDFCRSIEDENRFLLLEEWNTHEDYMNHLESDHFRVFQGAMNLLQEPLERVVYTISLLAVEKKDREQ